MYSTYSTTPMPAQRKRQPSQTVSSAFSACANPNEDWTKITDFEERRRIQTRIAQRNYRIKQKQQQERAEKRTETRPPTPELTPEELVTPWSGLELPQTDGQQQETQNIFDISAAEVPQQQYPTFSDDCGIPVQLPTPPQSTPQPSWVHASTSETIPCLYHATNTGGQQQPTHNLYDSYAQKMPQAQYSVLGDECNTPIQQQTPPFSAPHPPCAYASTSGTTSCHFHTGSQQATHHCHNSYAPKPLQQPLNPDYQQVVRRFPPLQSPCACTPVSGPVSCHSPVQLGGQPQRMPIFYDNLPSHPSPWAGAEDYTGTSYGKFEPPRGSRSVDLSLPFGSPPQPPRPYIAVPSPSEQGCCCHHNHAHRPVVGHVPMENFNLNAPHPYQDTARSRTNVDFM